MEQDINTEVALLKKEVSDIKVIFSRLDVAIEKITDVSSCVNRMLQFTRKDCKSRRSTIKSKYRIYYRHKRTTFQRSHQTIKNLQMIGTT